MESLLYKQEVTYNRICKAYSTFRKSPKDRITAPYVKVRLENLEKMYEQLTDGHNKLLEGYDPDKLRQSQYVQKDVYNITEETYMQYKIELEIILESFESKEEIKKESKIALNSKQCHVKLPKIVIPVFSGKYTDWVTFRDLFVSLIHKNPSLDNVQRMQYLKGYLSGEAEQLLRQIPISDANYERCWQQLNSRYNNKRYLSHFILKRLLSQRNLTSESAFGLKELIDNTNDCLKALENLGIDVKTWDIIVIHIITLKLDPETRKQWEFNITSNNSSEELPTFVQFTEFLTNRYRALEFLDNKPGSSSKGQSNYSGNTNKVNSLHVTGIQCPCCSESHKLSFCKQFYKMDCDARRSFVQQKGICFNCLGKNHSAKECNSIVKCKICKRRHHSLLHPQSDSSSHSSGRSENNNSQASTESSSVKEDIKECKMVTKHSDSHAEEAGQPLVTCFSTGTSNHTVLLSTALIRAESKAGIYQVVRALIDQGSQVSLVTEATVQYLGLKKIPSTHVIKGVGGDKEITSRSVVIMNVKSRVDSNFNIKVKAYVLKSITSLLPVTKVNAIKWFDLQNEQLADPQYHTPNKINVLLGADVYRQIIEEGLKRNSEGSVIAQCSKLGWILSGVVGGEMGNFAQNQMPGGAMGNFAQNQMPGGAMGNQNAMPNHGPNVRFGNPNMDNQNNSQNNQQQMGQMAQPMAPMGMGPKILNMMMGEKSGGSQNQGGPQGGANANNAMQPPAMGMTSNMHGDVSQGQYNADMTGNHPGQYNMGMNNMVQESPGVPMQNPTAQYMSQPNMYTGANANMQGNSYNANMGQMNPGAQQMQGNANPIQPQMNAHNPYGQHSAGMAKFNEMFPGVMQGGDLGFDPMAIAIQMNPANQQRAAMDTMQKMMMKNTEALNRANASLLQPVINATNTAMSNLVQPSQPTNQQAMVPTSMQQQIPGADPTAVPVQNNQVPQQQVYTAMTGSPTMNQRQILQQVAPQYQQPRQQMVDPNTGAVINGALPTVYEGSVDPNARQEGSPPQATQQMIKEPIFPADTSRSAPPDPIKAQKYYQYNTLGQPIEMLPVDGYRTVIPDLPQTLSPQVIPTSDSARYSNVKATVSKTALMGNRPVGRTPSRSQLQQIYNQYKGSQSYTQQNIRPPDNNGASYSEGNLNVTQANAIRQAPVERVGGDTVANNASNNAAYKMEIKPGQVGDVPVANKPPAEPEKAPVNNSRVRNGLQDMKYTSYATSAAWSFHGATPAPSTVPAMYRFRNRA